MNSQFPGLNVATSGKLQKNVIRRTTRITLVHASRAVLLGFLSAIPALTTAQEPTPSTDVTDKAPDPGFFLWTDTSLSLLPYGVGFEVDPSEQSTITIEHAHESKIGDMFIFVDFTKFQGNDKADGNDTIWYGEIAPRLSFGKIFDENLSYTFFSKSMFEIKDILLAGQWERGEDPDYAEAALVGIGFDLDVREAGVLGGLGKFNYVQLNLYARDELADSARDGFHDMQVTMVASYPFTIGKSQFLIDGYFDWVLGLGDEDWSYHLNPQITMDVGAKWDSPGKLYAGIELDFWWNKYQIPDSSDFDTDQKAVSLLIKYHM